MIRTLIIDIDVPDRDDGTSRWSAADVTAMLQDAGFSHAHVWGELDRKAVDAAYRKTRQLSRETEDDATKADRVHSAHKALSFWIDSFPLRWWKTNKIGERRTVASGT